MPFTSGAPEWNNRTVITLSSQVQISAMAVSCMPGTLREHNWHWERQLTLSYLSITVTLTSCGCLWGHACRRGRIAICSEFVKLQCDEAWAEVRQAMSSSFKSLRRSTWEASTSPAGSCSLIEKSWLEGKNMWRLVEFGWIVYCKSINNDIWFEITECHKPPKMHDSIHIIPAKKW